MLPIVGKLVGSLFLGKINFAKLLFLFKKHWKIILLVLMLAGIVWKHFALINENEDLRSQMSVASERIDKYIENEATYERLTEIQNAAIQKLKKEGEQQKKRLSQALENARKSISERDKQIAKLAQSKPKDESCEATMDWMLDTEKDLRW